MRAQATTIHQAFNAWKVLPQPPVMFVVTYQRHIQEKSTIMHHCGEMWYVVNSLSLRALFSEQLQL